MKIGEALHVETHGADRTRPATEGELAKLTFRKCVAPARLEKALKAHCGIGPWEAFFDSLRAEIALQSASIEL